MSATIIALRAGQPEQNTTVPTPLSNPDSHQSDNLHSIQFSCHDRIGNLAAEWQEFEKTAVGGLSESLEWCSAWLEIAEGQNIRPKIIVGRSEAGKIVIVLPFALVKRLGARVACWLGEPISNHGIGLYDPAWLASEPPWQDLWPRIEACLGAFDALHLRAMPETWDGFPHPLRRLANIRQANDTYVTQLTGDFDELYHRKRSSESRRGERKRDSRLERSGNITLMRPQNDAERDALLETLFAQRRTRLGKNGIAARFDEMELAFAKQLGRNCEGSPCRMVLLALCLNGMTLAVTLGCSFRGTYHALTRSMAEGFEQKHSPGDAVLRRTIEECYALGLERLDFGPGFSSYKLEWADETIPLRDALHARRARGIPYLLIAGMQIILKRRIKTSRVLWPQIRKLRRLVGRFKPGRSPSIGG